MKEKRAALQGQTTNGNMAQKFIPSKLFITGEVSVYPQGHANVREAWKEGHRHVQKAYSHRPAYSFHYDPCLKTKEKKDFETESVSCQR